MSACLAVFQVQEESKLCGELDAYDKRFLMQFEGCYGYFCAALTDIACFLLYLFHDSQLRQCPKKVGKSAKLGEGAMNLAHRQQ